MKSPKNPKIKITLKSTTKLSQKFTKNKNHSETEARHQMAEEMK